MPAPYTRWHSLGELEAIAYATNDRATLEVIELAEEACGVEAERVRERRADKLLAARGADTLQSTIIELRERLERAEHRLRLADELASAVRFVLAPFVNKPTKRPKWAHHLHATLQRIAIERGPR